MRIGTDITEKVVDSVFRSHYHLNDGRPHKSALHMLPQLRVKVSTTASCFMTRISSPFSWLDLLKDSSHLTQLSSKSLARFILPSFYVCPSQDTRTIVMVHPNPTDSCPALPHMHPGDRFRLTNGSMRVGLPESMMDVDYGVDWVIELGCCIFHRFRFAVRPCCCSSRDWYTIYWREWQPHLYSLAHKSHHE